MANDDDGLMEGPEDEIWFVFEFPFVRPENSDLPGEQQDPSGQFQSGDKFFYDTTEEGARRQYKEVYGIDAGDLKSRNNW